MALRAHPHMLGLPHKCRHLYMLIAADIFSLHTHRVRLLILHFWLEPHRILDSGILDHAVSSNAASFVSTHSWMVIIYDTLKVANDYDEFIGMNEITSQSIKQKELNTEA